MRRASAPHSGLLSRWTQCHRILVARGQDCEDKSLQALETQGSQDWVTPHWHLPWPHHWQCQDPRITHKLSTSCPFKGPFYPPNTETWVCSVLWCQRCLLEARHLPVSLEITHCKGSHLMYLDGPHSVGGFKSRPLARIWHLREAESGAEGTGMHVL